MTGGWAPPSVPPARPPAMPPRSAPSMAWWPQLLCAMWQSSSLTRLFPQAGVPACCSVGPRGSWGLTASSPHRLSRRVVVEAGGHRSLGLPLAPKPCSALLLLLPAWNPGLSALCAGAGLLFQSCGLAPVGTASWPHGESFQEHQENTELMLIVLEVFVLMWGPCSVLGYVAAMGGLSATPVASVAYRLHHPGLLQLCCQPHPLLLPFLLLPGRAQGPLL